MAVVAWPPPTPPNTRTNSTPQLDAHISDHNRTADALDTLIARVGVDELVHTQITAPVSITATVPASATTVITAAAVTLDGGPVIVEFYAPALACPSVASGQVALNLWDGAADLGYLGQATNPAAAAKGSPCLLRRRITPTAGAHTFSIRGWVSSGTGSVTAGTGAINAFAPAYLRVVRA